MCFTEEQLYEKIGIRPWPLSLHEAVYCLQIIPYATDSTYILKKVDFLDGLGKEISNWNLLTITKSALYFYLLTNMESRKKRKQPDFIGYDWYYITCVILNEKVSKEVVSMLQIFYLCPLEIKIVGVKAALDKFSLFYRLQISQESLNNLLTLLDVDDRSKKLLIKETFKEKSFKQICDFLALYQCSVKNDPVFTKALLLYRRAIKKKNIKLSENSNSN